ncbi:hypothetical protein M569_11557 [Genlisea aurea]|uniref:Retrotransposon gag domain-containing protein n=1 Tax=Genlisea aurea TaxID=192259 RepID=S8C8S2_9LAMI|nr:hypothetical protein M569_11557 [Genlisea aurea]
MEPGREEEIKLQAFPFSLMDGAKNWFYSLDNGSIHTWKDMRQAFLEKYFPPNKVIHVRKDIFSMRQQYDETLYEYWERYKKLLASCPKHQLGKKSIILYFYEGLTDEERRSLDAAAGGNLKRKTADEAREIITMMANNSHIYNSRTNTRGVHAATENSTVWEQKIDNLTEYVVKAIGSKSNQETCEVCSEKGHEAKDCRFTRGVEEETAEVNAATGPSRYKNDPYSNTYNPGWRNHPNFSWRSTNYENYNPATHWVKPQGTSQQVQQQQPQQQQKLLSYKPAGQQAPQMIEFGTVQTQQKKSEMEELIGMMRGLTQKVEMIDALVHKVDKIDARMDAIETSNGLMATKMAEFEARFEGKIPSQPVINPKGNVSAVTLRSGRPLQDTPQEKRTTHKATETEPKPAAEKELEVEPQIEVVTEKPKQVDTGVAAEKPAVRVYKEPPPFPGRFRLEKKQQEEKELLKLFGKIEINIPLIEAIKTVPRYAKFLKDLCTTKRKLRGTECVNLNEQASAMFSKRALPEKCTDPGVFTIPCVIGKTEFKRAMIDLGASINLMPYSIYSSLKLGPLQGTGIVIKLADRTSTRPEGLLEDVLVQRRMIARYCWGDPS